MYLQLAENGSDYTPIETNQGILMVRNDMLSEDVTLSARGQLIAKAAPVIAKAAPVIAKAAPIAAKIAQQVKTQRAAAEKPPVIQAIGTGLKKLITKAPAAAIIPAAAAATAAKGAESGSDVAAAQAADAGVTIEKQSFFKKYKTPLLIGGGVLVAGGLIYALTRKTRK